MADDERKWSRAAHRLALRLENRIDELRARVGLRTRPNRPVVIVPYRGYGTADTLYVRGRVLHDPGVRPARPHDAWWRNVLNAYRRIESDEVPNAHVEMRLGDAAARATSDVEGHFQGLLPLNGPLDDDGPWHHVELQLEEHYEPVRTRAPVLVPPPSARFGVISDMDDTVIRTEATSLMRMLRLTFFENPHTRVAFPGVAAFFRALHQGGRGTPHNPLFYVSSSPWNLYDFLSHFLELNDIPAGPLMLRDWGFSEKQILPTGHRAHKLAAIRRILNTYPALPFILVGDSGQEDPEIYRDIVHDYRGRILAVYIRNVTPDPLRGQRIQELADEVEQAGTSLVLADDTLGAARHAADHEWIDGEALERVAGAAVQDEVEAKAHGEEVGRSPTVVVDQS